MDLPSYISRPTVFILLALVMSAGGAALKLHYFGTTESSDYIEYVATAHAFSGDTELSHAPPNRVLKPLAPLLIATLSPLLGDKGATLLQSLVFYLALVVLMYLFSYEFLRDHYLAFLSTLMVSLSYPMLKYGVDIFTETGAVFFYTLSLFLTLRILRAPRLSLIVINALVIAVGFLWKEYSIVAGVTFGLVLLFHPTLSRAEKWRYMFAFGAIGALITIPWQIFVALKYHYWYGSWYHSNAGPGFAMEFTLKNVLKSIAAVLGLAWLLVPAGFLKRGALDDAQRRFLQISVWPPFMALAWGYISSRLFYVMAPPFLMLAAWGMRDWRRSTQTLTVALIIAANVGWLFLSYSIKL